MFPKKVTIVEVSPRDGLQNEHETIPTDVKLTFIHKLADTGLKVIETTSFVSPKWVPQMADHQQVVQHLQAKPGVIYPVLIPNRKGLENAIAAGIKNIAVLTAATETFTQKNTRCSIEESLTRIAEIADIAKQHQISVRGYISCVLGCPYEGTVAPQKVAELAERLWKLGCYEIALGDTIGVGTPIKAQQLIETVSQVVPIEHLAVHFHDTYGQALANIYACLEKGIAVVDSSVAGLGGCPYAAGASGNVATEEVIFMLNGMGIETGVDLTKLIEAGQYILQSLNHPSRSKTAQAVSAKCYANNK